MRNPIILFTLVLFFLPTVSHAQDPAEADSIYRLLLITPGDTNLIYSLNSSIDNLTYSDPETALYYAKKQDSLSVVVGYPHGSAMALNLQGVCYELSGDMRKAIEIYLQAAKLSMAHNLLHTLSTVYNNLGIVYSYLGAIETSLDYHFKSLELAESLQDSSKISVNYNNIGLRLSHLNQEERAIEYYKKALKVNLTRENYRPVSSNYLNLGRAFVITERFDSALYYYHKAMHIFETQFPKSMDKSLVTNGLAYTYLHLENLDSARHYLNLCKEISERTNDFYGKLEAVSLEGAIFKKEGQFELARKAFLNALDLAEETGLFDNEIELYRELAEVSHNLGDNDKAYSYYLRYIELNDSLFNVEKINEIANIEFTYQVDKQARLDSLEQVQAQMLRLEGEKEAIYLASRRNALEFSGIAFFVLIIFLIILMNRKLKLNDKMLNLLIFIFFVIIFEASLVAFDPLIDQWSQGEVLIKVIFNSGLAFAIFTAHHFLEGRMIRMIRRY
ncbi:MAG: tetratricopeptide repeat protein [Bacteroidia bacterium]|nr:MAG: tetratricopeptide repeat protein [Bacteroidia bacterium]